MYPSIVIKKVKNFKNSKNIALFCDKKFKIFELNNLDIEKYSSTLREAINQTKKSTLDKKIFFIFNLNASQRVILIKTSHPNKNFDNEKLGADFFEFLKMNLIDEVSFTSNNIKFSNKQKNLFFNEFLHGIELKSIHLINIKKINKI